MRLRGDRNTRVAEAGTLLGCVMLAVPIGAHAGVYGAPGLVLCVCSLLGAVGFDVGLSLVSRGLTLWKRGLVVSRVLKAHRQFFVGQCSVCSANFLGSTKEDEYQKSKIIVIHTCFVLMRFGSPCFPSGTIDSTIPLRSLDKNCTYSPFAFAARDRSDCECDLTISDVSQRESRK